MQGKYPRCIESIFLHGCNERGIAVGIGFFDICTHCKQVFGDGGVVFPNGNVQRTVPFLVFCIDFACAETSFNTVYITVFDHSYEAGFLFFRFAYAGGNKVYRQKYEKCSYIFLRTAASPHITISHYIFGRNAEKLEESLILLGMD